MKRTQNIINHYAAFYLAIFPWVYLFHAPARTSHKMVLFLVLALPFIVRAPSLLRRGEVRLNQWLAVTAFALLAAIIVSGAIALLMFPDMPMRRVASTIGMATWLLAMASMAITCDGKCLQRALQWLSVSMLLAVGVVFILDWTIDFVPPPPTPKLGLGLNTISLGKLLLAAVPGALLVRNNLVRIVLLLLLSVLIFMTGARTIILALLATIAMFLFLQGNRISILSTLAILLASTIAGVAYLLQKGMKFPWLISTRSLKFRYEAWINALSVWWRMNPLTGVGANMHRHYLHGPMRLDGLPYSYQAGHAHNEYIAALADLGIVGFLVWSTLLVILFLLMWKRRHEGPLVRVGLAIFIGYLVAGLTEVHFMRQREMTLVVVVMVLAFSAGVRRTSIEASQDKPAANTL